MSRDSSRTVHFLHCTFCVCLLSYRRSSRFAQDREGAAASLSQSGGHTGSGRQLSSVRQYEVVPGITVHACDNEKDLDIT